MIYSPRGVPEGVINPNVRHDTEGLNGGVALTVDG